MICHNFGTKRISPQNCRLFSYLIVDVSRYIQNMMYKGEVGVRERYVQGKESCRSFRACAGTWSS